MQDIYESQGYLYPPNVTQRNEILPINNYMPNQRKGNNRISQSITFNIPKDSHINVTCKDTTGSSYSLGMFSFGLTTILAGLANAGIIDNTSMNLGMDLAVGAFGQVLAAILEYFKGNTWGATIFYCFGVFWYSYIFQLFFEILGMTPCDHKSAGFFNVAWDIFAIISLFMAIGESIVDIIQQSLFVIMVLFYAIGNFTEEKTVTKIGGYCAIVLGIVGTYNATVPLINNKFKKIILPVGRKGEIWLSDIKEKCN